MFSIINDFVIIMGIYMLFSHYCFYFNAMRILLTQVREAGLPGLVDHAPKPVKAGPE